ncbi:MAG TPA: peptidase S16 [Devosia sp.]|nr:peptidase S16 [Devosia sp.]
MSKRPRSGADIGPLVSLLPLSGALLLPRTQRPLVVFESRYISLVDTALGGGRLVGLVQPLSDTEESPADREVPLRSVGCLGYITQFEELPDARYMIILEGVCRFEIVSEVHSDTAYRTANISTQRYLGDFDQSTGEADVDRAGFLEVMRKYAEFADIDFDWAGIKGISTADLVNTCCLLSPYGASEKQVLLEASTLAQRAETLVALAELEMTRSQQGVKLQ